MFTYTRILTDEEMDILNNELPNVAEWINQAIAAKINKCRKRIVQTIVQEERDLTELAKIDTNPVRAFLQEKKNGQASPSL